MLSIIKSLDKLSCNWAVTSRPEKFSENENRLFVMQIRIIPVIFHTCCNNFILINFTLPKLTLTTHLHNKEGKRKSDIYLRRYIDNAPFEQYEWTRNYFLPSYSYSMCTNSDFFFVAGKMYSVFYFSGNQSSYYRKKNLKGSCRKTRRLFIVLSISCMR